MSRSTKVKILLASTIILILLSFAPVVFNATELVDTPLPSFNKLTDFVDSNRYTHKEDYQEAFNQQAIATGSIELDTEMGKVYVDEEALSFQFVNSRGYIWGSTIDYENSDLNNYYINFARSAISIISFNTNNANNALVDENLFTKNTTKVTTYIENGFQSVITFGTSKIKLTLKVTFTKAGIQVEIPSDSIDDSGKFKLYSLKVYPFFGAVREDNIPGYVFVPDGVGALVRYKKANSLIIGNYQKEFYDRNISYNTEQNMYNFRSIGERIFAPVYGFVHGVNQNAIFANIIDGSLYGMMNLYYAGKITNYTTIFPEFIYRRSYKQPMNRAGDTITLLEEERNSVNIKINYTSLEGSDASYVGMAKTYRDYLTSIGQLSKQDTNETSIPLKVDAIGLEKTTGVLFKKNIVMTTLKEYKAILDDLKAGGIDHIVATLAGYTSNGFSWSPPYYQSLSSKVGTKKELTDVKKSVNRLYLMAELQMGSSRSKGFNRYLDLAKKINDQNYTYVSNLDTKYLLKPKKTKELLEETIQFFQAELGIDGIASEYLGNLLYADYSDDVMLEDTISLYQDMLSNSGMNIGLASVNHYLWGTLTDFFDFPMYSSQYITFDDTVPFLAIVLKGSMELYGTSSNYYPYARDELLRLIDFGVNPSFVLTQASSKHLQETLLESIYSSQYSALKEAVKTYYHFVNGALQYVNQEEIISRTILANQLVEIGYANDIVIVVNYHNKELDYQGLPVMPKNYLVLQDNQVIGKYEEGGKG